MSNQTITYTLTSQVVSLAQASDLDDLMALYGDSKVTESLYQKTFDAIGASVHAQEMLATSEAQSVNCGLGIYICRETESGAFLGYCGLLQKPNSAAAEDDEKVAEMTFAFKRSAWGQGLASEAAEWLAERAVADFGITTIEAFVPLRNEASRRLLEKISFKYEGPRDRDGLEVAYLRRDQIET